MQKLILIIAFFGTIPVYSQASASAEVNTVVNVIEPIKIGKRIDLNFGNVVSGYQPGSLTLFPDGTRIVQGVEISPGLQGDVSPAEAIVTHGDNSYSISLPQSFTLYNQENPNQTILIDQFTVAPQQNTGIDGADILKIGATLNLEANQVPGFYTNSGGFNVTVTYN